MRKYYSQSTMFFNLSIYTKLIHATYIMDPQKYYLDIKQNPYLLFCVFIIS